MTLYSLTEKEYEVLQKMNKKADTVFKRDSFGREEFRCITDIGHQAIGRKDSVLLTTLHQLISCKVDCSNHDAEYELWNIAYRFFGVFLAREAA